MTIRYARKALVSPLVFGDKRQVAAVEFIQKAEIVADILSSCSHGSGECGECDGEGECPHCGKECEYCRGTGLDIDCECFVGIDKQVSRAAVFLKEEREAKGRMG